MDKRVWAALLAVSLIWASTFLVIRIGLEYLPPFTFAAIRFVLASILLILYQVVRGRGFRVSRADLGHLAVLGLLMTALPFGLVFWGQQYISSGLAAVLNSTVPFFVAFLAYFWLGEEMSLARVTGIVVGFTGVIFLSGGIKPGNSLWGVLALLASAGSYGAANVYAKKRLGHLDAVLTNTWQTIFGALMLVVGAAAVESGARLMWSWQAVAALLFLSIFGSAVAFGMLFWLLQKAEATQVAMVGYIIPVISVLIGTLYGEPLAWPMVAGIIVVLVGVMITEGRLGKRRTGGRPEKRRTETG
ncbi:MAG: EamA family transporter [Firmicutes bacterium]|nr:EamA family transporter [Bacillota bacterium]